jgi:hypothetical protein
VPHVIAKQSHGRRPQSFDDEAVPCIMLSNMLATCHLGLRWRELKHGTSACPAAAFNDNFRSPPVESGSRRGNGWETAPTLLVIPISPLVLTEADDGKPVFRAINQALTLAVPAQAGNSILRIGTCVGTLPA